MNENNDLLFKHFEILRVLALICYLQAVVKVVVVAAADYAMDTFFEHLLNELAS